jgi:hypothetical protein
MNLDDLEALEAAATDGPWAAQTGMDATVRRPDGSYMDIGDAIYHPAFVADAAFIAALRNAAPELIRLARLGEGRDVVVERELRKRLTRHHRDEHVTAVTCRSCIAALQEGAKP